MKDLYTHRDAKIPIFAQDVYMFIPRNQVL